MDNKRKRELRLKRHARLRKKVKGTGDKPRLAVFKSARHFYAQIIDDASSHTLLAASTLTGDLKLDVEKPNSTAAAEKVGVYIAKKAREKGIEKVVFDHGGFGYHGKIKKFADKAREAGLKF